MEPSNKNGAWDGGWELHGPGRSGADGGAIDRDGGADARVGSYRPSGWWEVMRTWRKPDAQSGVLLCATPWRMVGAAKTCVAWAYWQGGGSMKNAAAGL